MKSGIGHVDDAMEWNRVAVMRRGTRLSSNDAVCCKSALAKAGKY